MSDSSENTLLTAEDVARIMKVSTRTVRRWVATGQIEIVEIGKQDYRINNDHRMISMFGADLQHAHLRAIDLRDTYLAGANLSGADLRGANLTYATLSYVNLTGANLAGADLHGSDMHNVDLTGADLTRANLKDAFDLGDTLFAKAKSLSGATMLDGTVHP